MELDRYVSELQTQLAAAAEHGDTDTRAVAEQLNAALDGAVRLMLLGVLSDVAGEITRQIAPGSVDVLLRGRDPHLVVTRPEPAGVDATAPAAPEVAPPAEPVDDTVTSRTTLRLPDRLKSRVEQAAAEEGVSVNSWFVRTIAAALEPTARRAPRRAPGQGDSFTGWAR
ncbi:toxin-antitoxin system HicB family antitoxin [Micromonospora fluostatini]|uniref:Toxin-antitoxin system HicB family antitoxin n=1 Tax=Micromonospora fluostatini TaxID=1629071 RepID=A0ABY2DHX9_9ACTN|nr:toxin-antitoxin system HicB family antitoxin [Micromonospora fluostatini]